MVPLCTQLDYMVVSGQYFFFLLSVQVALKKKTKKKTACNIEKVGIGMGTRLVSFAWKYVAQEHGFKSHHFECSHCT